jgi:Uma2 family endonuclease/DNA-binding XRE family transcriptional regulator
MQNRIRLLRTERKWSQAHLAESLEVSRQTVNALEGGKYDPSLPLALKIAQLFETSVEAIFSTQEGTMFAQQSPSNLPNLQDAQIFHKFTPKAVKVIKLAQKESRRLGHNFVGTEQILLGLIEEGSGIAAQVLKMAGVNLRTTRLEVEKIIGRGDKIISVGIPFTPRAKLSLDCAIESANELGHYHVDTENLLLGLLRANQIEQVGGQGEGVAANVLKTLGVDLESLEQQVLQVAPRGAALGIAAQTKVQLDQAKQEIASSQQPTSPITDFTSSEISARFCALLFSWVEPRRLGRVMGSRTEFHLPDGKVLAPSLAFVAAERLKRVPRTYPQLAPDMVVEIKSAFDSLPRLQETMQEAIAVGVRVGLMIDPDEQTVTVYRPETTLTILSERDVLTVPELFPDWELPIATLWPQVF